MLKEKRKKIEEYNQTMDVNGTPTRNKNKEIEN